MNVLKQENPNEVCIYIICWVDIYIEKDYVYVI
jgi:hypothetical protein